MKGGPGYYDIEHKLTEKRADIGVLRIKEPIEPIKEEVDARLPLYPNYDIDKPNKLVFQYHEPVKGLSPPHTPDKELMKEHWKFYDVNLNAIRAEIANDLYFHPIGLSKEEFLSK